MKGVIAFLICVIMILPSLAYAADIEFSIYRETADRGKNFGNIDVKPGETINAFIYVENTNQNKDDDPIENIAVNAIIADINEGEDIEEDYNEFDLKPKRTESLALTFLVPLRVEEKNYPIKVTVEGTDNNLEFSRSDEFLVRVKKEQHKIYFSKLSMEPSKVKCNEVSYLNIELLNLGANDENVDMSIKNNELGFSLQRQFSLEKYPGDDSYKLSIPIKIPLNAASGTYPFEISLSYNNKAIFMNEIVSLGVECSGTINVLEPEKTEEESGEQITIYNPKTNNDAAPPKVTVNQEDGGNWTIPVLLGAFAILAVIIIIFLRKK